MGYKEKYRQWLNDKFFDDVTRKELASLTDEKEIEDRFYRDLEFGTGGLRSLMGAGTNRMNKYTVGRATVGLGKYLVQTYGKSVCKKCGVVIGYDTRTNSRYFSETVADVLTGMGIRVYLHARPCPTPQLSFSVKYLKALAGIIITASHNPKEYNGYKVYDEFGCQLVPRQVKCITSYIDAILDYHTINFNGNNELLEIVEITENFVAALMKQSRYRNATAKSDLKIIYTPLHGAGRIPIMRALAKDGFSQVDIVQQQADEDGDFPTVISPNPEDCRALELGIAQAKNTDADIVLGTDPDSDRVGIAVRRKKGLYQLMTGNQVGALLMNFILRYTDMGGYHHPAVVKTIVTSELGANIARKSGVAVFSTLTGFKYIGEKIEQFEQAKMKGDDVRDYDFLFGYEESYGYLAGTHACDKDAVISSILICEMAAEAKANGRNLFDEMQAIYMEYGYYCDGLDSFTIKGIDGQNKIFSIMSELRTSDSPFSNTKFVTDFSIPVAAEPGFGFLPTSDVLKYVLEDGSWIAVRPSGTEPKIKIYYSIRGKDQHTAENSLKEIRKTIQNRLGLKLWEENEI